MDLKDMSESVESKAKSKIEDVFDNKLVEPKDEKANISLCHMLSRAMSDINLHPNIVGKNAAYWKAVSDEIDNIFNDYL